MKMPAMYIQIPIGPHFVIQVFASSLIVSVLKMAPRFLATSARLALPVQNAKMCLRWLLSLSTTQLITTILLSIVKSLTVKGKIPMVVTSRPLSLCLTNTQTIHQFKRCITWDTKLPLILLHTRMINNSGHQPAQITGLKKWLGLVLSLINLPISPTTLLLALGLPTSEWVATLSSP